MKSLNKSRNGIYYDLNESDYIFQLNDMEFYFSSNFYLDMFKRMYKDTLKTETSRLSSRYKCNLKCDMMILLNLYKEIEKRGFRVLINNKAIQKDYNITLIFNYGE